MDTPFFYLLAGITALSICCTAVLLFFLIKKNRSSVSARLLEQELERTKQEMISAARQAAQTSAQMTAELQRQGTQHLSIRQDSLQKNVLDLMGNIDLKLGSFVLQNDQKLETIRQEMERRLNAIQQDNQQKLEQMRLTVDEKLQRTLETRIGQSFSLVSQRLEQVYKGLGEMQTLAAGVGDLKKVLSNVKTRGILGEVQLSSILEQILSPCQYDTNVMTKQHSRAFVEFAVKLPGDGETPVYLPIDAKFPGDGYTNLLDAYDKGDPQGITEAKNGLEKRLRASAKEIREKYIDPPYTTDFAVLFLPFEGLYAEALRLNLLEPLQREYKVTIAGPTTMAALLNSLQLGFQTLAIQKRSSEVWDVLGAVKTEFDRFGEVLSAARQRLRQADDELDRLVGVRTRMIQKRLSSIGGGEQRDGGEEAALLEEER